MSNIFNPLPPECEGIEVAIADGKLKITVGTDTLIKALKLHLADYMCSGVEPTVTDPDVFLEAVVGSLNQEDEQGRTCIHKMLDRAGQHAFEQGCEGIELTEEPVEEPN